MTYLLILTSLLLMQCKTIQHAPTASLKNIDDSTIDPTKFSSCEDGSKLMPFYLAPLKNIPRISDIPSDEGLAGVTAWPITSSSKSYNVRLDLCIKDDIPSLKRIVLFPAIRFFEFKPGFMGPTTYLAKYMFVVDETLASPQVVKPPRELDDFQIYKVPTNSIKTAGLDAAIFGDTKSLLIDITYQINAIFRLRGAMLGDTGFVYTLLRGPEANDKRFRCATNPSATSPSSPSSNNASLPPPQICSMLVGVLSPGDPFSNCPIGWDYIIRERNIGTAKIISGTCEIVGVGGNGPVWEEEYIDIRVEDENPKITDKPTSGPAIFVAEGREELAKSVIYDTEQHHHFEDVILIKTPFAEYGAGHFNERKIIEDLPSELYPISNGGQTHVVRYKGGAWESIQDQKTPFFDHR